MANLIEKSFSINITIMKILYMYPKKKSNFLYKTQGYILHFIVLICVPVLILAQLLLEEKTEMMKTNYNASYVAEVLSFAMKALPFISRGKEMKQCINYFSDPYFVIVENEKQKKIVDECVRICRRNSTVFVVVVTAALLSWIVRPLSMGGTALPLDIWLPWDMIDNPKIYFAAYVFTSLASVFAAFLGTTVDPLIGGLAYQAACQLKILKDNLQHLKEYVEEEVLKDNKQLSKDIVNRFIYIKIKKCLRHHNAILKFVDLYDDNFSFVVFGQFAGSAFGICFSILQLTAMDVYSVNGFSAILCILICLGQIFFYCYYGSVLFEENNSLTNAVYMGKWYEYDVQSRRALIIMMERSKKPLIISAGKILDLTLETFTTVIKSTYSLLAVLQNYQ